MDKTLSIYPLENTKLPAFTFRLKTISVCVVLIRIRFPALWYARSAVPPHKLRHSPRAYFFISVHFFCASANCTDTLPRLVVRTLRWFHRTNFGTPRAHIFLYPCILLRKRILHGFYSPSCGTHAPLVPPHKLRHSLRAYFFISVHPFAQAHTARI